MSILGLEESLSLVKEDYRGKVGKIQKELTETNGEKFDEEAPNEQQLISYFRSMREDRCLSSSTLWTYYSALNVIIYEEPIHLPDP